MAAVLAAKEKMASAGEALPEAQTRVWGSALENVNGTEASWPATSTLAWGWRQFYAGTASDSLVQRYYNSNAGRFYTPDPSGSVLLTDPQSWNKYLYARGDPVNRRDPRGLMDCVTCDDGGGGGEWWCDGPWDPFCFGDPGSGGGGGGPGGRPFAPARGPEGTGPWTTSDLRNKNLQLLQSLAAAAIAAANASDSSYDYVAYLKLVGDCYELKNPKTGGPTRDRTYWAYDENNRRIVATIAERVLATSGGLSTITYDPLSSSTNGIYQDQVGLPFTLTGSVTQYQYFVTTLPGTAWVDVPTQVLSPAGTNMVFSITMSHTSDGVYNVTYNGDSGMAALPRCGP